MATEYSDEAIHTLHKFYAALQPDIHRLEQLHAKNMVCKKGCFACCEDHLEVFGVEAENIRRNESDVLKNEKPHPAGMCAFLSSEGACRIYENRPFVCRTQGLPLLLTNEQGEKLKDVCPLNFTEETIDSIPEKDFLLTPAYEDFLARLQMAIDKGAMERVALRDLFQ